MEPWEREKVPEPGGSVYIYVLYGLEYSDSFAVSKRDWLQIACLKGASTKIICFSADINQRRCWRAGGKL